MVTKNMSQSSRNSKSADAAKGLMEKLKVLEEMRVKTFKFWQYGENENCSIQKMAEAGFFYCGTCDEDDSATCYVCGKVLDGWENSDDPWSEHEKHAPRCQFVQLHQSQDELTVEQFFNLSESVIKGHITNIYNKKLAATKKRTDEIITAIKNQQS